MEWTIPEDYMNKFREANKSVEEILDLRINKQYNTIFAYVVVKWPKIKKKYCFFYNFEAE